MMILGGLLAGMLPLAGMSIWYNATISRAGSDLPTNAWRRIDYYRVLTNRVSLETTTRDLNWLPITSRNSGGPNEFLKALHAGRFVTGDRIQPGCSDRSSTGGLLRPRRNETVPAQSGTGFRAGNA